MIYSLFDVNVQIGESNSVRSSRTESSKQHTMHALLGIAHLNMVEVYTFLTTTNLKSIRSVQRIVLYSTSKLNLVEFTTLYDVTQVRQFTETRSTPHHHRETTFNNLRKKNEEHPVGENFVFLLAIIYLFGFLF